jgi:sporulation protein YlmC with PRC-barrel domain
MTMKRLMLKIPAMAAGVMLAITPALAVDAVSAGPGDPTAVQPIPDHALPRSGDDIVQTTTERPSFDRLIRGETLIGYKVVALDGKEVGAVSDMAIGATGRIEYLVVSRGGFLGVGDHQVLVSWSETSIKPDVDKVRLMIRADALDEAWRQVKLSGDGGSLGFEAKPVVGKQGLSLR